MSYSNPTIARRLHAWIAGEHFRYARRPDARPTADEIDLTRGWRLEMPAGNSPLLRQCRRDFTTFLTHCLRVRLTEGRQANRSLVFQLCHSVQRESGPADSFTVDVTEDGVTVTAAHERGLLHAAHDLERRMAMRGGPFLAKRRIEKRRWFDPYISHPMFNDGPSLSLMSHFGVNGMLFPMRIWDYCRNTAIPELNTRAYARNVAVLRRKCRAAAVYGIDLYLDINHWGGFPGRAPLFRKRPDIRGAEFYYSVNGSAFDLCASHPDVRKMYAQSFANLFRAVPELGGVSAIVGCEGLMHCFSFPKPPLRRGTNCPRCSGRDPSQVVATLVNDIAHAVHQAKPAARFFVWPYSADFWSGKKDPAQTGLIRHLNPEVCFISNFETPYRSRLNGVDSWVIDYNIRNLGPSKSFATQSRALARKGLPHYAKTESAISVFFFTTPYIPVHYRWAARYERLRAHPVPGIIAKWHFYGLTGSLPEELLCETTWEEKPDLERLMAGAVRRDFGTANGPLVLKAWKRLSSAWEQIPISHLLSGERCGYMKGPFWLGPAHPLIFDVQRDYGLSRKFVKRDPGRPFAPQPQADLSPRAPHAFCSDLLFTYPFTPAAVETALRGAVPAWARGMRLLERAMGAKPSPRATMELDVCRTVGAILRTSGNVVRFYRAREAFFCSNGDVPDLYRRVRELRGILDDEVANARALLPILERDPRIGNNPLYGTAFDAGMIQEKIRQCLYVRNSELPFLTRYLLRFNFLENDYLKHNLDEDVLEPR